MHCLYFTYARNDYTTVEIHPWCGIQGVSEGVFNWHYNRVEETFKSFIPVTGVGTNSVAGLMAPVGPGKVGRRLFGSITGPLAELCPVRLRTSTYFLAEEKKEGTFNEYEKLYLHVSTDENMNVVPAFFNSEDEIL